jgi:hypothetical protein
MTSVLPVNWNSTDAEAARMCCQEMSVITKPFFGACDDAMNTIFNMKHIKEYVVYINEFANDDYEYDGIFTMTNSVAIKKRKMFNDTLHTLLQHLKNVKMMIVFQNNIIDDGIRNVKVLVIMMSHAVLKICKSQINAEIITINKKLHVLIEERSMMYNLKEEIDKYITLITNAIGKINHDFPHVLKCGIFV